MSGPLDVSGIRRDYEEAREHIQNHWACCQGHRLGAEVPLLLAEIERLTAALAEYQPVIDEGEKPLGFAVEVGAEWEPLFRRVQAAEVTS